MVLLSGLLLSTVLLPCSAALAQAPSRSQATPGRPPATRSAASASAVSAPTVLAAAASALAARTPAAADTLDPVQPAIDHSRFDRLLHQHVAKGLVDYAAFRNNPEFTQYLASLEKADPAKFDEPERIAFWLNVYNAYTIALVATNGETESIRNIDKTFGVLRLKGPWSDPFVKAAGRTLTLDDVEHRILRKEFSEPRIHFAMSFAALGGPPMRAEAYTGARLDEQLEDQAHLFLRESPAKNRVDTTMRTVYASPILTRYSADFGASPTALGSFLADYYPAGSNEQKMLKPRAFRPRDGGLVDSVKPVFKPNAAKADSAAAIAKASDETAQRLAVANANRLRQLRSQFRLKETDFDWRLNGMPAGREGRSGSFQHRAGGHALSRSVTGDRFLASGVHTHPQPFRSCTPTRTTERRRVRSASILRRWRRVASRSSSRWVSRTCSCRSDGANCCRVATLCTTHPKENRPAGAQA